MQKYSTCAQDDVGIGNMIDKCIDLWTAMTVAEAKHLQTVCTSVRSLQGMLHAACTDLGRDIVRLRNAYGAERTTLCATAQVDSLFVPLPCVPHKFHVYVCMMHVCAYVDACVHKYERIRGLSVCVCAYICMFMHACMYGCMYL